MKEKITLLTLSLLVFFLIVLTTFMFLLPSSHNETNPTSAKKQNANTGWFYEDGKKAVLSDIHYKNDEAVLTKTVTLEDNQPDLCIIGSNINFTIYLDDKEIYNYTPVISDLVGVSYGSDLHVIHIPLKNSSGTLKIHAYALGNGKVFAGFRHASFEDGTNYYLRTFYKYFWKFLLSLLIFASGLISLIIGLSFRGNIDFKLENVALGTLIISLALWTDSGTYMFEMLTGNPQFSRVINFYSLLLVPISGLILVSCITTDYKSKAVIIATVYTLIDIAVHFIGLLTKKLDYHDLLIFTHLMFVYSVIAASYMMIKYLLNRKKRDIHKTFILGAFVLLTLSGMLDMVLYYVNLNEDVAHYSRIGLLIFSFLLGAYEYKNLVKVTQKSRQSDLMEKLAHEDGLTKLENRLAFSELEKSLKDKSKGNYLFAQFDINNLKTVNDKYGHSAGDSFITGGAEAIRDSFGKYGRVFRTGGDEFISIIPCKNPDDIWDKANKELEKNLETYNTTENPPILLTIAMGYCSYNCNEGNPAKAFRIADENMYEHKKKIKAKIL